MLAHSLRLLLALTIAFSLIARAAEEPEHSPLHDKMEALNRDLRQLKRGLAGTATKEEQLKLADKMLAGAKEVAAMKPLAKDGGAADAGRIADYQKRMEPLVKEFERLREAIAAGKADAAKEIVNSLYKMKEEGHEAMGVEED